MVHKFLISVKTMLQYTKHIFVFLETFAFDGSCTYWAAVFSATCAGVDDSFPHMALSTFPPHFLGASTGDHFRSQ